MLNLSSGQVVHNDFIRAFLLKKVSALVGNEIDASRLNSKVVGCKTKTES